MEATEKNFQSLLNDILHFQSLRKRCQPGEYDEIMYSQIIDKRLILLEQIHSEMEAAKK